MNTYFNIVIISSDLKKRFKLSSFDVSVISLY